MSTDQKDRRYDKPRLVLGTIIASLAFFYCVYISFREPIFTPAVALVYGLTLGLSALVLGGRLDINAHPMIGMAIRATGGIAFLLLGMASAVLVIERFQPTRQVHGWLVDEDRIRQAPDRAIRIGAKNFAESNILAELIAYHLRKKEVGSVDVLNSFGSSRALLAALVTGDIDIYVEYTGTLLQHQLSLSPDWDERASKTCREECDESTIQSLLAEHPLPHWARLQTRIEPVVLLGFSSNYHIVITRELYNDETRGDTNGLKNRHLSNWIPGLLEDKKVGATEEFTRRKDGLLDLVQYYGGGVAKLQIARFDDVGGKYSALKEKKVDWVAGFSTDPEMPDGCQGEDDQREQDKNQDFVRLVDDRSFWPEYQAVALSRTGFLDKYPDIRSGLWEMRNVFTCELVRETINKADDVILLC